MGWYVKWLINRREAELATLDEGFCRSGAEHFLSPRVLTKAEVDGRQQVQKMTVLGVLLCYQDVEIWSFGVE